MEDGHCDEADGQDHQQRLRVVGPHGHEERAEGGEQGEAHEDVDVAQVVGLHPGIDQREQDARQSDPPSRPRRVVEQKHADGHGQRHEHQSIAQDLLWAERAVVYPRHAIAAGLRVHAPREVEVVAHHVAARVDDGEQRETEQGVEPVDVGRAVVALTVEVGPHDKNRHHRGGQGPGSGGDDPVFQSSSFFHVLVKRRTRGEGQPPPRTSMNSLI